MKLRCRFTRLPVVAICVLLVACGPSNRALAELGHRGSIDAAAPIKATATLTIHASIRCVWNVLTDLSAWPRWQSGVKRIDPAGILGPGTSFTWQAGGMTIRSKVVLFEPPFRLAWIGRAYTAHAVHVFALTPLGPSVTRVESRESMAGPFVGWFYDSAALHASEVLLLQNLKQASEAHRNARSMEGVPAESRLPARSGRCCARPSRSSLRACRGPAATAA